MLLDWLLLLRDSGEKDLGHYFSIFGVYTFYGRGYYVVMTKIWCENLKWNNMVPVMQMHNQAHVFPSSLLDCGKWWIAQHGRRMMRVTVISLSSGSVITYPVCLSV